AVQALGDKLAPAAAASPMATAWIAAGVPRPLAQRVASAAGLYAALDIAEIAEAVQCSVVDVAEVHAGVAARLGLTRLRDQIEALPSDSHWQALAKAALGDDLWGLQRSISQDVLAAAGPPAQML